MTLRGAIRGAALGMAIFGGSAGTLYLAENVGVPWTGVARTFLVNPPATRGVVRGASHAWTYSINSDGLRGPEIPRDKRPGTTRLLVLGDSMTFGYGVRDDETYPAVLQALLNEGKAPGTFEVINVSRAGVGPWEYLLYLETFGRRYRPDVVLIGLYLGNDLIEVVNPYEATSGLWPIFRRELRQILPHTYALLAHINSRRRARGEFLESGQLTAAEFTAYLDAAAGREGVPQEAVHSRLRQVDPETYRLVLRGEVNPSLLMKALLHPALMHDVMLLETPEMARAWGAAQGVLGEMFRQSRRLGARPVVVLIPEGMQVSQEIVRLYQRLGFVVDPIATESRRPQSLVTSFTQANGVPVIDLIGAFLRPRAGGAAYLPLDTHWNARGHRVAAEAIREALVRHGVIGAGRATP